MRRAGWYVVIEGSDGTGKSTHVRNYADYPRQKGYETLIVEEPGGTEMADSIRVLLKDGALPRHPKTNIGLFTSARVDLWHQVIAPALELGRIVIASRSYLSSVVYQGYGEGVDIDYIKNITELSLPERYVSPDARVILALPNHADRFARMREREIVGGESSDKDYFESKPDDFQVKVDQGFKSVARDLGIAMVDVSDTKEKVFAQLLEVLESQRK